MVNTSCTCGSSKQLDLFSVFLDCNCVIVILSNTMFFLLIVQEVVTPIYILSYYINWGNYFLDTWYVSEK